MPVGGVLTRPPAVCFTRGFCFVAGGVVVGGTDICHVVFYVFHTYAPPAGSSDTIKDYTLRELIHPVKCG